MQVQTSVPAISPSKYLICLEQANSPINHLAIFLTGAFEPGFGASVFASLDLGASWRYLGVLANEKPSAFFRLSNTTGSSANANASSTSALSSSTISSLATMQDAPATSAPIQIGISIEPISVLEQLMMEHSSQALVPLPPPTPATAPLAVAQRIGEHLFNYMASFGRAARELDPACPAVPLRAIQDWFNALMRRASTDPEGFLRKFAD